MTYKEKVIDLLKRLMAATKKKKRDYLERYECSEDVKRLDGGLNFANDFLVALASIKEDPVPEKIGKEPEGFVVEGKTITINKPPVDDQHQFNLGVDESNVFTEPAESEDERIRKDIVALIKFALEDGSAVSPGSNTTKEEALAYLEKQKPSFKQISDGVIWDSGLRTGIELEKQERKPVEWTELTWKDIVELEGIINNVHYDFSAGIGQESFGKEVLERFRNKKDDAEIDACEQKPILEVFGFKVGDAVRLKDGDGRKHIIKAFEEVEGVHGPNFYHVEFEDDSARDGIYPGEEYPNGYYTQMEKFEEEQKPEQYSPLCDTVKDKIREYIANHFVTDTVVKTDIKSIVKAMEEGVRLGKESLNPAWSEEEMKVLNSIIDDYEKAAKSFCGYDGKIGLLKAIRDGEYDLPKQKWSEEDSIHLANAILSAEKEWGAESCTAKWLEFLPERFNLQPKQEWSEEDKGIIELIEISTWDGVKLTQGEGHTVHEWLKDLPNRFSSRPHWKPTQEQMDVLRKYVMGEWKGLTFKEDEHLKSLLIDLENYSHDNR